MSTAWSINALTVANVPLDTSNIIACETTILFAATSATSLATVQTDAAHYATTQGTSSPIALSQRTLVRESSSIREIQRDFSVVPVVQIFEEGNVTVQSRDLFFSIVHLPALTPDSPLTFTLLVMFFADTFRYIIC